ncbi:MAG: histidine kinase [Saprospiraceae bacterium]|nr:histidine kinase [Saprospiraceae bacterium]
MKRHLFLLCSLLLLPFCLTQAQGELSQLKQRLKEVQGQERLDALVDLVKQCYYFEHPDSSLKYADLALTMAEAAQNEAWQAKALYSRGFAFFAAKRPDSSLVALQAAEKVARDTQLLISIFNLLGNNFYDLGLMEMAMDRYLQAIEYARALGEPAKAASAYANVGRISSTNEEYKDAKEYYRYSSNLYLEQGDTLRSMAILMNQVSIYLRLHQPDSAILLADWGLRKSQELEYPAGVNMANIRRAQVAIALGNFEHALAITQGMLDSLSADNYQMRYNAWHFRGMALDSLGQFDAALLAAQKAEDFALLTESEPILASTYLRLYEAYKNIGNSEQALHYYEIYRTVGDSILDSRKGREVTAMQHLYEKKLQDKEIQTLQDTVKLEQAKIRQLILLAVSVLLLFALIATRIVARKQQKAQQEQQERQLAEQRLLSLQMNPHFLFNSLTSLQRYLLDNEDTKTAQSYLGRLASLMRDILEQSREKLIPLSEEIESLELYLSLQKLRWKDRLNYSIDLDPALSAMDTWIPPLLVQPLVENAIEHSGITEKEEGELAVSIVERGTELWIKVADNGSGWPEHRGVGSQRQRRGLALDILKDRLQILSKLRQEPHEIQIQSSTQAGTQITLKLPNDEGTYS